jgi:hypothetical protein
MSALTAGGSDVGRVDDWHTTKLVNHLIKSTGRSADDSPKWHVQKKLTPELLTIQESLCWEEPGWLRAKLCQN